MTAETLQLDIQKLGMAFRLPLLQIAFPLIKKPAAGTAGIHSRLDAAIDRGRRLVDTFEFALSRVLKKPFERCRAPATSARQSSSDATAGSYRHLVFPRGQKQGHAETLTPLQRTKKHGIFGPLSAAHKMLIDTQQWPDYVPPENWAVSTDAALNQLTDYRC